MTWGYKCQSLSCLIKCSLKSPAKLKQLFTNNNEQHIYLHFDENWSGYLVVLQILNFMSNVCMLLTCMFMRFGNRDIK